MKISGRNMADTERRAAELTDALMMARARAQEELKAQLAAAGEGRFRPGYRQALAEQDAAERAVTDFIGELED